MVLYQFGGAETRSGAAFAAVDNTQIPMIDRLAAVNLFLALFNMIPAFPMDGGRVLRALLAIRLGFVRATEIAASIGQGFAFLLGFIGLFYNPILIFIAIFVYLAASSEAHMVALRAVSRGVPVSTATMTQIATLTPDAHIDEAVQTLLRTSQSEFPVVDAARRPVGLLGRGDIIRALKELGPDARVSQAMTRQGAGGRAAPHPRRCGEAVAGKVDARGRRGRSGRAPGRHHHLGDHRRIADGARGAAELRFRRSVEPAGGRLSVCARSLRKTGAHFADRALNETLTAHARVPRFTNPSH